MVVFLNKQVLADAMIHIVPFSVRVAVDDWDLVEQLWRHANRTSLSVDLSQTPVLLVERAFNSSKYVTIACLIDPHGPLAVRLAVPTDRLTD